MPTHWSSQIPKKIKRNIITKDLHRAKKLSSNFNEEVLHLKQKYQNASYPVRFIESIIRDFKDKNREEKEKESRKDEKPFVLIRIPYCEKNEKIGPHFLAKLRAFNGNNYNFRIIWQMKKIKTLFKLKDEIRHKANVIYKGTSIKNSKVNYIGETALIAQQRWKQHEDPKHNSAPSKFLKENEGDQFEWVIPASSSSH